MLSFKEFMAESTVFDIPQFVKHYKEYSHGPHHKGYIAKTDTHADLQPLARWAKQAGYKLTHKDVGQVAGKDVTYHTFTKYEGPHRHRLEVVSKQPGKIWTAELKKDSNYY